jgi:hypothetical protein
LVSQKNPGDPGTARVGEPATVENMILTGSANEGAAIAMVAASKINRFIPLSIRDSGFDSDQLNAKVPKTWYPVV